MKKNNGISSSKHFQNLTGLPLLKFQILGIILCGPRLHPLGPLLCSQSHLAFFMRGDTCLQISSFILNTTYVVYEHKYIIQMRTMQKCMIKDQISLLFVPLQYQLLPLRNIGVVNLILSFSLIFISFYIYIHKKCQNR